MKKQTLYLLAAGVGALLLYRRSKAAHAAPSPAKDTQSIAGALGAVMTGNPMLSDLGSLGDDNPLSPAQQAINKALREGGVAKFGAKTCCCNNACTSTDETCCGGGRAPLLVQSPRIASRAFGYRLRRW